MQRNGQFAATNNKFDIHYLIDNAAKQMQEHYEKLQTADQSTPYTLKTKKPNNWHQTKHYIIGGDNLSILKNFLQSRGVQNHSTSVDSLIIYADDLERLTYQDAHHCLFQLNETLTAGEEVFFSDSPQNSRP